MAALEFRALTATYRCNYSLYKKHFGENSMSDDTGTPRRQLFSAFAPLQDTTSPSPVFTPGTPMTSIIDKMMDRRSMLRGSLAAGAAGVLGVGLTACGSDSDNNALGAPFTPQEPLQLATELNFESITLNSGDAVTLPEGYSAEVLFGLGDPINDTLAAYMNDGSEAGTEFDFRAGDHHDGIYFFGMDDNGIYDPNASEQGVICVNHENITQDFLHPNGASTDETGNRTSIDEVRKEQRAHGISCIAVRRVPGGNGFELIENSPLNRRITSLTEMDMTGPAAGSALLQTRFSPNGTRGRGTLNNCGHGFTPWGTYLTCEENFDLYFRHDDAVAANAAGETINPDTVGGFANWLSGVGVRVPGGLFDWASLAGDPEEVDDEFARFNVTPSQTNATEDFRNESNQYGYIVEIDPFNPDATPRKRTGLGRFAHEGCWPSNLSDGSPVAFYMGDDDQLQFIYKFVSDNTYSGPLSGESPLDTGDRFMNEGTLYVARFDEDDTGALRGTWISLTPENPILQAASANAPFAGLFDTEDSILIHARGAAFTVGATPMDRPEWSAVDPANGEVYLTLTNNSDRRPFDDSDATARADNEIARAATLQTDAPRRLDEVTEILAEREFGYVPTNPRGPNSDGHIIRLREDGDDPAATSFTWEIFLFGSAADASSNRSGLGANNEFTDCDGLWFDNAGVLWIQTDGTQPNGNNQMLASIPGRVGDGGISAENGTDNLRRFLVGPVECEITGITQTPDRRTLFVNVQHPGQDGAVDVNDPDTFLSTWPAATGADAAAIGANGNRARSATIVITKDDGGLIGSDFEA